MKMLNEKVIENLKGNKFKILFIIILLLITFHSYIYDGLQYFLSEKQVIINYEKESSLMFNSNYLDRKYNQFISLLKYAAMVALVFFLLLFFGKKRLTTEGFLDSLTPAASIFTIPVFILLFLVYLALDFAIIYFSFGFLHHEFTNISFWRLELENGVLALRLAALMMFLESAYKINILSRIDDWGDSRGITWKSSWSTLGEKIGIRLIPDIIQMFFYMLVIYILAISIMSGVQGLLVIISSWTLFFIVDDWRIISSYKNIKKICPIKSHRIRILLFNAFLFILTSLIAYELFKTNIVFLFLIILLSAMLSIEIIYSFSIKNKLIDCTKKDHLLKKYIS